MQDEGLVSAIILNGKGGGRFGGWDEVRGWSRDKGVLWLHLNYMNEEILRWLREESGLDSMTIEALTAEETRPRSFSHGDNLAIVLRGVNLNPGADPDDMVSIRAWIEPSRIITVRHRRVMAIEDLRRALKEGKGPADSGEFLAQLCDCLSERMSTVLSEMDDAVDDLEDKIIEEESYRLRSIIGDIRRQAIRLRRYLAPQREVLLRLQTEKAQWLDEVSRARIREVADRVTRYVEDLDSARERAAVIRDELEGRLAEQMNKTMYVLSIVAAIFLPLGLLTGLLGINVGGIPGAENPLAFWEVCLLLVFVVTLQILLFWKMKWLRR
jgi:zinc transporter